MYNKIKWTGIALLVGGTVWVWLSFSTFTAPIDLNDFKKYEVTLYRDTWGVPHVFGKTDADAAYGIAFAHAEDDFDTIQNVLLAAKGKLATVLGKAGVGNDYMVHLLRIWAVVDNRYELDLTPQTRDICKAYADGLNHYAALHQEEALPGLFPLDGKDIVAGFVHRMPLMFGLDKVLSKLFSQEKPVFADGGHKTGQQIPGDYSMVASNVIAVGPSRSADGYTRIAINSHQPWQGPVTWYEAHIHSEEGWNVVGGLFPGSPVVFKGFNPDLAWSHTVNNPDLIDVYELEINPEDENQYSLDGRWFDLEVYKAPIKVKLWGPFSWTFKRSVSMSVHGPVIRADHGTYAIRFSGYGEVRQVEQWYEMNKSRNLEDFQKAMSKLALPMFNTVYADKHGNIFYVYNALMFLRRGGYDWSGIVPGNTGVNLWKGYLDYEHLPQVINPASGFLQNCNSTPFLVTLGNDNPEATAYPRYLGIETFQTNRAYRAVETFGSDTSITREEFYRYKFDTYYSERSVMAKNLKRFLGEAKSDDARIQDALNLLEAWDLDTDQSSLAAGLAILSIKPRYNPALYIYDYAAIMSRLEEMVEYLQTTFGRIDVPWGEVQRLRRGSVDLPLSGGPDVLRAIYSHWKDGRRVAHSGDCYFQMVEWDGEGNVSAESIHQYGTATLDTTSVHYGDQAVLFAEQRLKPVWIKLEDILQNLERSYSPGD